MPSPPSVVASSIPCDAVARNRYHEANHPPGCVADLPAQRNAPMVARLNIRVSNSEATCLHTKWPSAHSHPCGALPSWQANRLYGRSHFGVKQKASILANNSGKSRGLGGSAPIMMVASSHWAWVE